MTTVNTAAPAPRRTSGVRSADELLKAGNLERAILSSARFASIATDAQVSDLAPGDPRREFVKEIQKAGATAAGVTRQLLAFSHKQIVEPTLVDLNDVVTDMRGMLERLIGADITIRVLLQPKLTPVLADRG